MTNDLVTQSPTDSSLAQHLLSMALGVAQTSVLCTAAQLGLADHLKDGPKSVAALAEATGTHPPTLTRLLTVLAHLGLCAETAPGQFACTPLGALLQTDAPQSLRHFAMAARGTSELRTQHCARVNSEFDVTWIQRPVPDTRRSRFEAPGLRPPCSTCNHGCSSRRKYYRDSLAIRERLALRGRNIDAYEC